MEEASNVIKTINKEVLNVIKSLDYEIDYENDIEVETAKKILIDSIDVSKILEQFKRDDFGDFQKAVVLEALNDMINKIQNF